MRETAMLRTMDLDSRASWRLAGHYVFVTSTLQP